MAGEAPTPPPAGPDGEGRAAGSPAGEPAARPADARERPTDAQARLADACARRAAVYHALALGFGEPSADLVDALESGELVAALREAVAWLGAGAASFEPALAGLAGGHAALAVLATEHARLFTGPGRPAVGCYASQYLDAEPGWPARLNGTAAAWAAAAYAAAGVALADGARELPDHALIELEFLYHLCRREERAWTAGDAAEADRLHGLLDRFVGEHAGLWLPGFAAAVRVAATTGPYAALADLLVAQLAVERDDRGYELLRRTAGEGQDRPWTG